MTQNFVNSFQTPNDFVDADMSSISGTATKCYLVIVRKTMGWHKTSDAISVSQFCELTGINRRNTIMAALKELEEIGLIESAKENGKVTSYRLAMPVQSDENESETSGEKRNRLRKTPVAVFDEKTPKPVAESATATGGGKRHPTKDTIQNTILQKTDYAPADAPADAAALASADADAHRPSASPSASKPAKPARVAKPIKPGRVAKPASKTLSVSDLIALGVEADVAQDFLAVRKAKNAPLTRTALKGIEREALKAGLTLGQALTISAEKSWQGFEAAWLIRDRMKSPINPTHRENYYGNTDVVERA